MTLSQSSARTTTMRQENDAYPTPTPIIETMLDNLRDWWGRPTGEFNEPHIWEPCAGDGRLVRALEGRGYKVTASDIATGQNFFTFTQAQSDVLITNPPFKRIRQFIDHAFEIGVVQMALVAPERLWSCGKGSEQIQRHKPALWANLSWREDYLNKGGHPDRALSVGVWDSPCALFTCYQVWDRRL